jgi:hypothetical protein
VFLVKLPNKLKDYLKDPEFFTLGLNDDLLGSVSGPTSRNNPEEPS